jgi:hypothetical protein
MGSRAEGTHEMRLTTARLAEEQKDTTRVGPIGRRRPIQEPLESIACLGMDGRHVERIGRPDVAVLHNRGKNLWSVGPNKCLAAEFDEAGTGGGHGEFLWATMK